MVNENKDNDNQYINLLNSVALVTGSTSGIGKGIALELAKKGCNLVLTGSRKKENALETIKEVENILDKYKYDDSRVHYIQANLTKANDAKQLVTKTIKEFGKINILVNNAGVQHVNKIEEFPDDEWNRLIAVNLSACFHTMKTAVPYLRKANFGRIINISSVHGLVASKNKAAYIASKHGLNGLTKVVALELAEDASHVTVNTICPGWVLTPLVKKQIDKKIDAGAKNFDEAKKLLLSEKQPKADFTTCKQIGQMVVHMCSTAGDNMTGTNVTIDGGWSAR